MTEKSNLRKFFRIEAASGLVLVACAVLAFTCANSPIRETYADLWDLVIAGMSLRHWINDGLMAIFFLVVGLEIKREIIQGELSSKKMATLPVAAALGGMLVPAIIYAAFNQGTAGAHGWGIPMATDIAFAIGVLALLGNRVPSFLKVFLTALAIVDDLGAISVIALFYTAKVSWISLVYGAGVLGVAHILNRMGVVKAWIYLTLGILVWLAFLKSGVHSTIAGVLLAFVIPLGTGTRLEQILHPWVSFCIMPLFALANSGAPLSDGTLSHPISLGIISGLVIGKQVGIVFFTWIAVQLKIAVLPRGVRWSQLYGIGWLGGIGFTMSLFIANLAFIEAHLIEISKLGILVASLISAVVGSIILFPRRSLS